MELIFGCPETHKNYNFGNFEIIDNHGVKTDSVGNKTLDAKVALNEPCPFCGKKHVYQASELSCPLSGND